jgi:hypothetical protein
MSNKLKVTAIFWRNGFAFRFNNENRIFLSLFFIIFLLLVGFSLLPYNFLTFSPFVLDKDFFHNCFVSVDCLKVEILKVLNTVDGRACSSCLQNNIFIITISHNKMQNVVKFAGIIGVANNLNFKTLLWFKDTVLDHRLEY